VPLKPPSDELAADGGVSSVKRKSPTRTAHFDKAGDSDSVARPMSPRRPGNNTLQRSSLIPPRKSNQEIQPGNPTRKPDQENPLRKTSGCHDAAPSGRGRSTTTRCACRAVTFENTIGQRQSRSRSSRPTVTPPALPGTTRDLLAGHAGDPWHCGDIVQTAVLRTGRGAGRPDGGLACPESSALGGSAVRAERWHRPLGAVPAPDRAAKPGPPEQHDRELAVGTCRSTSRLARC
jgi:hypothetical protein